MQVRAKTLIGFWRRRPVLYSLCAGLLLILVSLGLVAVIKKPLQFSYAGNNCVQQWTVFPSVTKQIGQSGYSISFEDIIAPGGVPLLAQKTCLEPSVAVQPGTETVSYGLFGTFFPSKSIAVTVPEPPEANIATMSGVALSATRPVTIPLNATDTFHTYTLASNDLIATCRSGALQLTCDTAALKLSHGQQYELALTRQYKADTPVELGRSTVTTLQPLHITESTPTRDQTIYDEPTSFTISFDRPVTGVQAQVSTKEGEKIAVETSTEANKAIIRLATPLAREKDFTLTVASADGDNGSSLAEPYVVPFRTSGGPKVASISIGASGVAQSGQIVLTFDQPINKDVDISKFVSVDGIGTSVSRKSDTQLALVYQNAGLCTPFTVSVKQGMKSGSNQESSKEPYAFSSRIVCGTSRVIGYSVKGRPIIAHYFGSGSKTFLFTGGIHGEEQSGTTTMNAWVEHLKVNAYKLPAGVQVVVVPNSNPDGIAANQRYNANNVNLARNFPASDWRPEAETPNGIMPTGGGTSPASEPETKAMVALVKQLRPRFEVSFHAQGRLVGANGAGDSEAVGNMYARSTGYATMYGRAEEVMGYSIYGEFETWMGENLGIPAIVIELPTRNGNYLSTQLDPLWKIINL